MSRLIALSYQRVFGELALPLVGVLLLVSSSGCALGAEPDAKRQLGERFVHSFEAQPDSAADSYLAPDAEVFVQGAAASMSRTRFREYVAQMKIGHRVYRAGSRIFATTFGAAWLLQISQLPDPAALYQSDQPEIPPELWMEARISDQQITRLWIHFTSEALPRMGIKPEAYLAAAAQRGMPVPEGWMQGTAALLAAAERADPANNVWTENSRQLLALCGSLLLVSLAGLVTAARRRRTRPALRPRAELLEKLGAARSAR